MASPPRVSAKRQHYDVVVIGAQLGGHLAAALLCKRGHRVLVVEHDGLGEGYLDGGYLLPYAPSFLPPLKSIPASEQAFGELGMLTDLGRVMVPHDPELQLLFSEHRFDLFRDPARRKRELLREFKDPDAAETLWASMGSTAELSDAFLKAPGRFPAASFWDRWGLKRRTGSLPELARALEARPPSGHPLAAMARELMGLVSNLHQDEPSGLAVSRTLALLLKGPMKIPGGREGLRLLLQKRIKELGGDILVGDRSAIAEELEISGSRVSAIRVVGGDATYIGRAVISATDVPALRRLLPPQARKKRLAEQLDAVRLRRFLLTVNLVVPEDSVPMGLSALGLMTTGDEEMPAVAYETSPAHLLGAKNPTSGERVICAGALVPAQARDLGDAHVEALANKIRDAMLEVMPFSAPNLISIPLLAKGPIRGSRLSPHPVFEVDEDAQLGVTGLTPTTALKNLFLASREVIPGLGVEGELLSGLRVAELVQGSLRKHDPLAGP
jgi:phytoene dehydrogenase-like protein